jgi:hypothetical protein
MTSISGTPVNPETGKALNPEQQGLLDSQNESEEYEGMSPLAMGLLQAGASMMRSGGWRNTPMTTGEAIGHAIPAGIGGYYNQEVMNQQGEAEFYERQQAEQQAQQAQDQARQAQEQEQLQIQQAIEQLDLIPTSIIRPSTKEYLKLQLQQGGKSAQDAMTKIVELTSEKRAGKVQKHPDFPDLLGQFDKDNNWKPIDVPEKDKEYNGSPLGTSEYGTPEATLVLNAHGISNVPKGTKYLDNNPIIIDKKVQGTHIIFKNKAGNEIESAGSTKDQNAEYISAEDYKAQNPNWVIPDNTLNVSRDKNEKILGYQIKDPKTGAMSYLAEHDKSWQQAKALHGMLGTRNLDKKGFLAKFPDLTAPPLATRIAVDKDNNITFFDKDGVEVKGRSLSRVNLVDVSGNSDDIISYHIDDKTGRIINRIGKAKIERTPVERLRYNQDRADKLVKDRNLNAMIDALGEDYNVDKRTLAFYREGVAGDYDKTFSKVTDHYGDFVSLDEAVVTGDILNKRIIKAGGKGDVYDSTLSYAKKAGVWEQYTPSSDWIVSGETGLRKDFNRITNDYRIAARGHDGVMEGLASDNGFGDIMAITSFRIMFEPNSVVREAEFEITSQAGGWFQSMWNKPHQLMKGDRLLPDVREKMKTLVVNYMKSREDYVDRHYNDYRKIAQKNFKSNAGIEHPFKSYKWSKHYDKKVKVNSGSNAQTKEAALDQLGVGG